MIEVCIDECVMDFDTKIIDEDIKNLSVDDFIISNYKSHKIIKGNFIS